jgi:hypothetical protein
VLSFFIRLRRVLLLAVVATLAACGGGGDPDPRVEFLGLTEIGGAKLRLTFTGSDGFSQPVAAGDYVVWHSGMVSGTQPTASRAVVIQGTDGALYAEITLGYTVDRGIFGVAPAGYTLPMEYGQPANHMLVRRWQLPPGMTMVPLNDGTDRGWINVSY